MTADKRASAGALELWLVDRQALCADLAAVEAHASYLSRDEIARAGAMADRTGALRWRAGRIALRVLLARHCGPGVRGQSFAVDRAGRPSLPQCGLDFALSDSGAYLLIACSSAGRIGVDIELPRQVRMTAERIARLQASAAALGRLPASPLQAWTRVEAFAKATGPSLAAVLARLGIQGNDDGKLDPAAVQQRSSAAVAASSLEVRDLVLPAGLVGALALPAGLASPSVRELDHGTITSLAT